MKTWKQQFEENIERRKQGLPAKTIVEMLAETEPPTPIPEIFTEFAMQEPAESDHRYLVVVKL